MPSFRDRVTRSFEAKLPAESRFSKASPPQRSQLEASDFVFSDTRTFPVVKPSDVSAAVHSWGRYRGKESFASFQSKLKALCQRKGPEFVSALPDAWKSKSVDLGKGLFTSVVFGDDR